MNPWVWAAKNPNKALWLFLGVMTLGAFLGWAAPGLVPVASWFLDNLGVIVGLLIAIPLAGAIVAFLLGWK